MARFGAPSDDESSSSSRSRSRSRSASGSSSSSPPPPPPRRRGHSSGTPTSTPGADEEDDDENDGSSSISYEEEEGPPPHESLYFSPPSDEDDEGTSEVESGFGGPDDTFAAHQRMSSSRRSTPNARRSQSRSQSVIPLPNKQRTALSLRNGRQPTEDPMDEEEEHQPWAKKLRLEPKRVALMQASLFQRETASPPGANEKERELKGKGRVGSVEPQQQQQERFTAAPIVDLAPFRQFRSYTRVPLEGSITRGKEGTTIDAGLALGRSFRVGWGPRGQLVSLKGVYDTTASGDKKSDTLVIDKFRMTAATPKLDSPETAHTLKILQLQLSHTDIFADEDTPIPFAVPQSTLRFTHFVELFEKNDRKLEAQLWRLGQALFDEIPDLELPSDSTSDLTRRIEALRRKRRLSLWLEEAVRTQVEDDLRSRADESDGAERVFTLLSGHQVARACEAAIEAKDLRLATLVSQAGTGDDAFRADVYLQLAKWREYKVDSHVSTSYRRVLELLCGNLEISEGTKGDAADRAEEVRISEGLDWKRAFGLHLWYGAFGGSVELAVERYERAAARSVESFTAPPLPSYLDGRGQGGSYTDPLFELVKIFVDPAHPLEQVLQPKNFGPSPLDHRLPWLLYVLFSRVLRRRDFEDRVEVGEEGMEREDVEGSSVRADAVTVSFADQLEAESLWQWGIFVLLHLELPDQRERAIKASLTRNVDEIDEAAFNFFTETLRLPPTWIYAAQATAEKYNGDVFAEYKLLLAAEMQTEAHELVAKQLAPEAVVRNDLELLKRLLQPFDPRVVARWDEGGKIFSGYADCVERLQNGAKMSESLSALLRDLIRTVPTLVEGRNATEEHRLLLQVCVAEMQSRLTVVASSLNVHLDSIRPSTLQEADRLVWLQASNSAFLNEAIRVAVR